MLHLSGVFSPDEKAGLNALHLTKALFHFYHENRCRRKNLRRLSGKTGKIGLFLLEGALVRQVKTGLLLRGGLPNLHLIKLNVVKKGMASDRLSV